MAPTSAKRPAPIDEDQRKTEAARRAAEIAARVNRNAAASQSAGPAADPDSKEGKLAAILAKINAQAGQAKPKSPALAAHGASTPAAAPKGPLSLAEIRARAAAAAASKSGASTPAPAPATSTATPNTLSALDQIKARAAASKPRSPLESGFSSPYSRPSSRDDAPPERAPAPQPGTGYQAPDRDNDHKEFAREPGHGGLGAALHPRLLKAKQAQDKGDQKWKSKQDEPDAEVQGPGTPKAVFNEGQNPYLTDWGDMPGWKPRKLRGTLSITHSMFHRPIMERENKRREAEALKHMSKDIEKQTTVESEEDLLIRSFTVAHPPEIDWWDEDYVRDVDLNPNIHDLVVQPILIEGPRKKLERKALVIPLTSREHKKARRIRRAREHEELTQKIRLGLEPAPGPKLTKQNFMRVMPEEAIKNPTYVEQLVNGQIQERLSKHEEANSSRQLSKEDRAKKTKEQAEKNAKMGLKQLVFRILLGTQPPYQLAQKHKFLLQKNAEQWLDITGVCLVGPRFALLFVEGGEKATRAYKHLVLDRVRWLEILADRIDVPEGVTDDDLKKIKVPSGGQKDNTCTLLFEGEVRKRKFPKKWGGVRDASSEAVLRQNLEKFGLESFFNQALQGIDREIEERETRREATPTLLNDEEISALLDPDLRMLDDEADVEMADVVGVNGEMGV